MLFGRGSTGGAVNQANKQPQRYGRNEAALTVGDKGCGRATLDYHQRLGERNALRVNLMNTSQGGNTSQHQDKAGLAASYSHGIGIGIGMTDEFPAGFYFLNNDTGIPYGLPWIAPTPGSTDRKLLPVAPAACYGLPGDYNTGSARYLTLSHLHRLRPLRPRPCRCRCRCRCRWPRPPAAPPRPLRPTKPSRRSPPRSPAPSRPMSSRCVR
ncbi:MAG: hypothetical protein H7242_19280, partial [Microbacteriaceae bacterium]|nr:hypothetical protein [Burkholderiaceae bacterium]